MRVRPNTYRSDRKAKSRRSLLTGVAVGALGTFALMGWFAVGDDGSPGKQVHGPATMPVPVAASVPQSAAAIPAAPAKASSGEKPETADGQWAGPILYRSPGSGPLDLILVEKATQKLHLYRYDGQYRLIKTYPCATGEKAGPKRREKDERTPVGIYFNTKVYRDNKITVFGDRAFELNYPDPFDRLAGNGGNGIFIHGSNRKVTPNSTNGCVALDNDDLADLDRRVRFEQTPIIIGERLPYRFDAGPPRFAPVLPFLRRAMVPEAYAGKTADPKELTLIGFQDRLVAFGRLAVGSEARPVGFSRLYLADTAPNLMVLFRREWAPEEAQTPQPPKVAAAAEPLESRRIRELVESWRQAWQGERLADYIGHYHSAFTSNGKTLDQWKAYKGSLNRRYKKISVRVEDLRVKTGGGRATAYFVQHYRSDTFRSDGFKVLVFKKEGGRWKIYRENTHAGKPAGWPS